MDEVPCRDDLEDSRGEGRELVRAERVPPHHGGYVPRYLHLRSLGFGIWGLGLCKAEPHLSSLGLAEYHLVDIPGPWYISVNFGTKQRRGSPARGAGARSTASRRLRSTLPPPLGFGV